MSVSFDDPISAVPGISASLQRRLREQIAVGTVRDLIEYYPRRWDDVGEVRAVSEVIPGRPATLIGEVLSWDRRQVPPRGARRRPLDLTVASVRQASGERFTVTFFNQPWRMSQLARGTIAAFSGEVKDFRGAVQLSAPGVEVIAPAGAGSHVADDETGDADPAERFAHRRLLSLYSATEALPSHIIANAVEATLEALDPVEDWLPAAVRDKHGLLDLDQALRDIHRPADFAARDAARRRLVFDELVTIQLGLHWRRAHLEADTVGLDNGPVGGGWARRFLAELPFTPTEAQRQAMQEVGGDLGAALPMHRLLQGDVGSGKTLVALWTMLCAVDRGRQAALMAPTAVLAEQHFRTLTTLLAPLGVNVLDGLRVELLTSATTTTARRRILGELLSGEVDLIVGTHALLEEGVRFASLGVVVIDEQHRFGVSQRVRLREKASEGPETVPALPDVLVMTATPIPRSLALTYYGDLDVTVLKDLPPGRHPIRTQLITPAESHRRARLEAFVRHEIEQGRRAYVVCPFVEDSDTLPGVSVVSEHRRLSTKVFPDIEVGLLHGRMRPDDKERAMARFRSGQTPILVTTTVVEVGVDVPEASLMIIEDAERFGISQLHQLRGRVGRGPHVSYCVLFAGFRTTPEDLSLAAMKDAAMRDAAMNLPGMEMDDGPPRGVSLDLRTWQRLRAVAATTDGFALAEQDLTIRGTGQLFGTEQSGLPDVRLAEPHRDLAIAETTREVAREVIGADPELAEPSNASLRAEVLRRYAGGLEVFAALQTG